jgi:hypothetical protein
MADRRRLAGAALGILCWALLASPAGAAGTTALEFLKLGIGARAAGMGDAFVSLADDASAAYWNPAGLCGLRGREFLFNHLEWFQDIRLENVTGAWGDETQGLGLSATLLHVGGLEERDSEGNYLGEFRFFDCALAASYAREIAPSLSAGVTGKFLMEQIDRERAQTVAADLGVLMEVPGSGLRLGAALTNLGPGLKFIQESEDLPLTISTGASYQVPELLPWLGGMTLAADLRRPRGAETSLCLGWEVGVAGIAHYRLGYSSGLDGHDIGSGFGLGFGHYRLDYAFVPSDFSLGDTHRFSLSLSY